MTDLETQWYQSICVRSEWICYILTVVLLAFAFLKNTLDMLSLSILVACYDYKTGVRMPYTYIVFYYFCIHIFVAFFTTFRAGLNIHFQISSICFYKSKNYTRKTLLFFSLSLTLRWTKTYIVIPTKVG